MKTHKMLNLDEESIKIIDKLFNDGGFSRWVRNKIHEEHEKEESIEYLKRKLVNIKMDIDELTIQQQKLIEKINLKTEEEHQKSERLIKEHQLSIREKQREIGFAIDKINMILEILKYTNINNQIVEKLAEEYTSLSEKPRGKELHEWVKEFYNQRNKSECKQ